MIGRRVFLPAVALAVSAAACGGEEGSRADELGAVLVRADEAILRTRPALVAGKYTRMAGAPFDFYRGQMALFRHDWERDLGGLAETAYPGGGAPLAVGDPHPENFGLLRAPDGTFALEGNDFDSAGRALYLWDVRRLVAGVSLAARLSNADDAAAQAAALGATHALALAAAESYATEVERLAAGGARARIDDPGTDPNLLDLFSRSARDTNDDQTFADLTVLDARGRRLVRGVLDPAEPTQAFEDLPPQAYAALPAALESYRATLVDPPPAEDLTLLDAVREFGSGVASWPRVRLILLVRGPTDDPRDDRLLELKELIDEGLPSAVEPGVFFDDPGERVRRTSRAAWARPDADPAWGVTRWLGFHCQVKTESSGLKRVSVSRLTGKRGTVAALTGLARTLGTLVGRIHSTPLAPGDSPASAIATAIGGDIPGFAEEQATVGDRYAAQVLADFATFQGVLADRGPMLGFTPDPEDAPSPDLQAVYGDPPH